MIALTLTKFFCSIAHWQGGYFFSKILCTDEKKNVTIIFQCCLRISKITELQEILIISSLHLKVIPQSIRRAASSTAGDPLGRFCRHGRPSWNPCWPLGCHFHCLATAPFCVNAWGLHCKEIWIYVFPGKELRGLSPNFHIHVSVSAV